jgi:hypothetical protein
MMGLPVAILFRKRLSASALAMNGIFSFLETDAAGKYDLVSGVAGFSHEPRLCL